MRWSSCVCCDCACSNQFSLTMRDYWNSVFIRLFSQLLIDKNIKSPWLLNAFGLLGTHDRGSVHFSEWSESEDWMTSMEAALYCMVCVEEQTRKQGAHGCSPSGGPSEVVRGVQLTGFAVQYWEKGTLTTLHFLTQCPICKWRSALDSPSTIYYVTKIQLDWRTTQHSNLRKPLSWPCLKYSSCTLATVPNLEVKLWLEN